MHMGILYNRRPVRVPMLTPALQEAHEYQNWTFDQWPGLKSHAMCGLGLKSPRSQSQACVGCSGQTCLIHRGPTSQLTGSVANILVPDTTEHFLKSMPRPFRALLAEDQCDMRHWTGGYNVIADPYMLLATA